MIYESYPWKQEIKRRIQQIKKYNTITRMSEKPDSTCFILEKNIMYSAFAIRKLIECKKLSDSADSYSMQTTAYKPIVPINRINRWPSEDTHDLEHSIELSVMGKNVCNWIIHSYIFCLKHDEKDQIVDFMVSSDYDKNTFLYSIDLHNWFDYLSYIANDDVVQSNFRYNTRKKDYDVIQKER